MIQITQLPLGPLQTNCYLLGCESSRQAAVIDPAWSGAAIHKLAGEQGYTISHILLTHSHFDHLGGLAELKEICEAPIIAHKAAVPGIKQAQMSAAFWNIQLEQPPLPDKYVDDENTFQVGTLQLDVLYTPGHAPGHISFHLAAHQVLFDGDVLFREGIGRTDLPGGDYETLMATIAGKLMVLPDETQVLSGHGPATTIGHERQNNPFLQS